MGTGPTKVHDTDLGTRVPGEADARDADRTAPNDPGPDPGENTVSGATTKRRHSYADYMVTGPEGGDFRWEELWVACEGDDPEPEP